MRQCEVQVTNFTLSILVKLYSRAKMVDKAVQLFDELPQEHGFQPNTAVRTCVMQACLNNGRFAQAQRVFDGMSSPDLKAYQSMLQGCVKGKKVREGLAIAERAAQARLALDTSDLMRLAKARGVPVP